MPEIKRSGYERWWPLKQQVGRNADGSKITAEVYRNMLTGEIHHPKDKEGVAVGWNGEPPPLDPTEKIHTTSSTDKYRSNYDFIDWKK